MFWENFLRLCVAHGLKPNTLAKKLDIPSASVTNWKNGRIPRQSTLMKIADYFGVTVSDLLDESGKTPKRGVRIPVYGQIAAGLPMEAVEDIIDYEEIPAEMARGGEYFALQIKGNSMEPRMFTGDIVIIRKQPDCESGQVCAVMIGGDEATLKRVIKRPGGITLVSFNPSYPPRNIPNKEIEALPVSILGVAVEVRGKL